MLVPVYIFIYITWLTFKLRLTFYFRVFCALFFNASLNCMVSVFFLFVR